jgi:taurine--2-oxoglutarate transaminase
VAREKDVVMHTWCVQTKWDAPTIVGGEGATFRDDTGRSYLDMSSLAESNNLGHQHPRVVAAIRQPSAAGWYICVSICLNSRMPARLPWAAN